MRSVAFLTAAAVLRIAPLASAQVNLGAGGWDGVMLDAVPPGTPAAQAGLQTGDVVVEVNGRSVDRSEDLVAAVQAAKPGSPLVFKISRAGREMSVTAVPQVAPAQQGARSGRFTLKGWQAYNFDRNAYEESSGKCDFCLTAQLRVGCASSRRPRSSSSRRARTCRRSPPPRSKPGRTTCMARKRASSS